MAHAKSCSEKVFACLLGHASPTKMLKELSTSLRKWWNNKKEKDIASIRQWFQYIIENADAANGGKWHHKVFFPPIIFPTTYKIPSFIFEHLLTQTKQHFQHSKWKGFIFYYYLQEWHSTLSWHKKVFTFLTNGNTLGPPTRCCILKATQQTVIHGRNLVL